MEYLADTNVVPRSTRQTHSCGVTNPRRQRPCVSPTANELGSLRDPHPGIYSVLESCARPPAYDFLSSPLFSCTFYLTRLATLDSLELW
jgi:hypothetical protein